MRRSSVSYRVAMLFCSNAILQLMGFFYRAALARSAPASALGLNSLIMQIYGIIVSFCISGLNVAVSAIAARTERSGIRALLRSALYIYFALFAAAALPVSLFPKRICLLALGCEDADRDLLLMLLCIFMTGIENVLKSVHMGTKHVKQCAASELCEQGVRFLLVIMLLRTLGHDTDAGTVFLIILGMTASELVSVGILTASFAKLYGKCERPHGAPYAVKLVKTAFPASLTALSSTVFASVGALLLPGLLIRRGMAREAALAGIGALNTVYVPLTMLPMAFAGAAAAVIMPEISHSVSVGGDPKGIIRKAFACVAAGGAASFCMLALFGPELCSSVFGMRPDAALFILLSAKACVIYLQVVSVAVLNGLMRQRTVLAFAVLGEAYQTALTALLAPVLGLMGYAAAMLAGELLRLLLNLASISYFSKNGMAFEPTI